MYCIKIVQFPPWMGCYSIVGLTPAVGWGPFGGRGGGVGYTCPLVVSLKYSCSHFEEYAISLKIFNLSLHCGPFDALFHLVLCVAVSRPSYLSEFTPKRASMLSVFIYTPGWRETKWSKVSSLRTQCKGKAWTWPSWSEVQVCNCSAPPLLPPSSQKR